MINSVVYHFHSFIFSSSNCNYVTSTGLHDADNGFVCTESVGSYGLPKYCCQSGEYQGIGHCDDVIPRNNPPRNNHTTGAGNQQKAKLI